MQSMLTPTSKERSLSTSGAGSNRWVWPLIPDAEFRSLLPSDTSNVVEPSAAGGSALEKLIELWAAAAVTHARIRNIDDPSGLVATVVGIDGAWGFGSSSEEALDDLRSVLIDWAQLKLEDGDDDIPSMEGLHLVVAR